MHDEVGNSDIVPFVHYTLVPNTQKCSAETYDLMLQEPG